MSERPIIFDGPSVRAILAGTKTQTRRVLSQQPLHIEWFEHQQGFCAQAEAERYEMRRCPYGVHGDRLWVRETWAFQGELVAGNYEGDGPYYEADGLPIISVGRWRSPIHMPRWASRLTLEITDVRVQRLQDISEEDAAEEGVGHGFQMNSGWPDYRHIGADGRCSLTQDTAAMSFSTLWDSLNGKRAPWSSNPWVWAISFKVVA